MQEQQTAAGTQTGQENPAIMTRFKTETRAAHDAAENIPFMKDLMGGQLPLAVNGQAIAQMGLVREKLESLLASMPADAAAVVMPYHHQAAAFKADAKVWGADADAPLAPTQAFIEKLESWKNEFPLALLAALYVLEGSNMGASIIRKRLKELHNLPADQQGLSSLDPHGSELMNRWRQFAGQVNALDLTDEQKDRMVDAASDTFKAVGDIHNAVYDANFPAAAAAE